MPQIFFLALAPQTQLAVWHITEPESFFSTAAKGIRPIAHLHKRLQHLCGRYLLQRLVPGFPLEQIVAKQNNKPFLPNHPYHFSISHCDDYVAAIVSTTQRVGIDVETISPKVERIRHKFLTTTEEELLANADIRYSEIEKLTLAWSTKEAMFKWLGEAGVDFKEHLILRQVSSTSDVQKIAAQIQRTTTQDVDINFRLSDGVVLTWLLN